MARARKMRATVVGFSETKAGGVSYIHVAYYDPKSKHVNVEFLRPGLQAPIGVSWGDRGFMRYSNNFYIFAKE